MICFTGKNIDKDNMVKMDQEYQQTNERIWISGSAEGRWKRQHWTELDGHKRSVIVLQSQSQADSVSRIQQNDVV